MSRSCRPARAADERAARPAGRSGAATGRRRLAGAVAVVSAAVALCAPTPYLVEGPGPAIDVLGELEGRQVLSVAVDAGADLPVKVEEDGGSGRLDLTTVMVGGPPTSTTMLPDLVAALLDPGQDLSPRETVYPTGTTAEEVTRGSSAAMVSSQQVAVAAALGELGVDYESHLVVSEIAEGSRAGEVLRSGDVLLRAGDEPVTGMESLVSVVDASQGHPVRLQIRRDGETSTVQVPVAPAPANAGQRWQMGVYLQRDYDFPVEVEMRLDEIGGPSAGLMFSLAVIDRLTPGEATGGRHIAGTGTVTEDGSVGPIGGIAQKVRGARRAGAEVFLAPQDNCADLDGRVPEGITVYAVDTVGTARAVLRAVAEDSAPDGVRTCG